MEQFQSQDLPPVELTLPQLDQYENLIDYLFEVGPMHNGETVRWVDIHSWNESTASALNPWELCTIYHLSRAYAAQYARSHQRNCPAPFVNEPTEDQRQQIANKTKSLFANLKARRKSIGRSNSRNKG